MKVIGYDSYAEGIPTYIEIVSNMESILQQLDFISLHLPLLESTKHIICSKQFSMMKKTAYFINATWRNS